MSWMRRYLLLQVSSKRLKDIHWEMKHGSKLKRYRKALKIGRYKSVKQINQSGIIYRLLSSDNPAKYSWCLSYKLNKLYKLFS